MSVDRRRTNNSGYVPLRDAIDQLFQGSIIHPQAFVPQSGFPPVDLYITEEDVVLEVAIPGANPEEVNISVTGDAVSISGEVKREQRAGRVQPYVDEIWQGKFQRSFALPIQVNANRAEASSDNGILTVRLPKSEATKPRKIQVTRQQTIQGESSQSSDSPASSNSTTT